MIYIDLLIIDPIRKKIRIPPMILQWVGYVTNIQYSTANGIPWAPKRYFQKGDNNNQDLKKYK